HPALGLADRAVVNGVLLVADAGDRRAAVRAGLTEPLVHAIGTGVGGAALTQLEAALELSVDRLGQPRHLLVRELRRQLERGQLRAVQDLVRPRAADPGQHPLVAQSRVQAPASLAQALAESFGAEAERLRTEPRELPLEGLRSQQPDAGALASTSLGQHQLAAAL